MGTPTASPTTVPAAAPPARIAGGLAVAAVVAVAANVAIGALGAVVAGPAPTGLGFPEPVVASIFGVLIGAAGWAFLRRFTSSPAAVLRVVVPVAVALSWIPNLLLLGDGVTVVNVVTLMAMHVVVAVALVPVLLRVLPVAAPR
jgi:hypothetical protein